jgi:hypothetical protein
VGGDETELVLGLDGGVEETLHQLERLLLVSKHATAVDALEVEVEVAFLEAGVDDTVDLTRVLGEEQPVVDGLHGVDGHLLAHPLNGLRGVEDGGHDKMLLASGLVTGMGVRYNGFEEARLHTGGHREASSFIYPEHR